jgi:hypothetical protein
MTRFLFELFWALIRALLEHSFAEFFRMILQYIGPAIPDLVCTAVGVALAVIAIEVMMVIRERLRKSDRT